MPSIKLINYNEERGWGSQRTHLLVLLCQVMGTPMFVAMPNNAAVHGATGNIIAYVIAYFVCGIPLLYMEFIISQFTARDSIDVWKVRPCLSHIGYVLVVWQIFAILNNHVTISFTFHYFIISFESPLPFYTCGKWSTNDCEILRHNYTVNEDCVKLKEYPRYCDNLHYTFPEYQYWKFNMLGVNLNSAFFVAWRVTLSSAIISVITFLSCFRRKSSLKVLVLFYTVYPVLGYTILLMGSMLQKGVVVMYTEALDSDFTVFSERFRTSLAIAQVTSNLGIGSGFIFNLSSGTSFRAPCYSNAVVAAVACAAVATLAVSTTAMMTCPYAYEHGIEPYRILQAKMSLVYEKIPRLLYEYQNKYFWLILTMSSQAVLGMSTNVILIYHMLEMAAARSTKVAKYPGLTTLLAVIFVFVLTIPLLGPVGMSTVLVIRRFMTFVTTFVAIIEILVFVIWYGLDRFTEDVHFMQGIQPKMYIKVAWVTSCAILCYVFSFELYSKFQENSPAEQDKIAWIIFIISLVLIVGLVIVKLLIAACRHRLSEAIRLEPGWGPRDEVLQRSRAMFSAQAMTKEYLYRQYHLQAGIIMRQKMSNCKTKIALCMQRNNFNPPR